uniref:Uncharacterized protein n=1 Tax=Romanomermis culicivorax TaxID=13658 RepID=A0A915L4N1_ROMCU
MEQQIKARMNFMQDMQIPGCLDNVRCVIDHSVLSEEDMSNMAIGHGPMIFFDKCTIMYLINNENMDVISCKYIPMKPSGSEKKFTFQLDGGETIHIVAWKKS